MKFVLLLCIFCLSISCSKSQNVKVTYEVTDIVIKVDSLSAYVLEYVTILNDTEYLVGNNAKRYSIDFYNLNTHILEHRVLLPFFFEGYYVKTLDSIFAIENEINTLSLFNNKGELLKEYNYDNLLLEDNNEYLTLSMSGNLLTLTNNKCIINIVSQVLGPSFYKKPTIGIFDYKNGELVKTGYFPKEIQQGGTYMSFYPYYCVNSNNEIVNSFAVSHDLFVYDLNGNLKKIVTAKSKYIETFEPIPEEQNYQRKYSDIYERTRNRYSVLLYDKYRNLYYRAAIHSQEVENEDGSINEYNSNPWSLIIMDSKFNILDEIMMEANKYRIQDMLICKAGIMLKLNEENMRTERDFEYKLLKIEVE